MSLGENTGKQGDVSTDFRVCVYIITTIVDKTSLMTKYTFLPIGILLLSRSRGQGPTQEYL